MNSRKSEYNFVDSWYIDAPVENVWKTFIEIEHWPSWWRGVHEISLGDGQTHMFTVGRWVYFLTFQLQLSNAVAPHEVLLYATGDLEGSGKFVLRPSGGGSFIRIEWHVSVTKPWMKMASLFARPFFCYAHGLALKWFADGMAEYMKVDRHN